MLVKETIDNFQSLRFLDKYMMGHKGFICGGCFKNIFNNEKVKDIDVFFKNKNDFDKAIEWYDSQTSGYNDEVSDENAKYIFCYENDNVKAYVDKETGIRIELCRKVFGTAEEIISMFDFTIAKFAYYKIEVEDESGEEISDPFSDAVKKECTTHIEYRVLMEDKFFEHLHMHRLVIDDKILYPVSSLERTFRYIKYGYMPCRETKMKIVKAIHELPEDKIMISESLYDGID